MRRALLAIVAMLPTGCGQLTFTLGAGPRDADIEPAIVQRESGSGGRGVAVIDITGMIHNARLKGILSESENPVGVLHEKLQAAAEDEDIRAVILRINSPGGTVTASDAMYREVMRFKRQSKKPVVVMMMDVAASGGYYVSCAADRIVAYPTSITASIGVIFQTVSFKPAMDRWGIAAEAITSGPNKDAASPLSTLTDSHRAVLRRMVDEFYGRFRDLVKAARPRIPADQFNFITDGRVVTGADALSLGLVDELGDIYDAHNAAKKLARLDHADLVVLTRAGDVVRSAYAAAPINASSGNSGGGTQINVGQINIDESMLIGESMMSFLYLWRP